jgi:hypothetical protein
MHLLFLYLVSSSSDLLGIKSDVLFADGWVVLLPIFSGFHGNCELKDWIFCLVKQQGFFAVLGGYLLREILGAN